MPDICSECGNKHYGACATEETCFRWEPDQKAIPKEVFIMGSWKKWQAVEQLTREIGDVG